MRTAFFADVHANREALTACLSHAGARGAARHVFLGDLVGYGADPAWVVAAVQDEVAGGALAVMGNHDAAVVAGPSPRMQATAASVLVWSRQQLDDGALDFLAALPLQIEEHDCLFVHANAWAPAQWEYVSDLEEAKASMEATARRITFCGHVHDPTLYWMSSSRRGGRHAPVSGEPIPLSAGRSWLAIAGSVGQPRDGIPAASYAVFDESDLTLTYFRVPYDIAGAAQKIRAAALPEELARRLERAF